MAQTLEERRESHAASMKKYLASDKGKQANKKARQTYMQKPGVKENHQRAMQQYNARPK